MPLERCIEKYFVFFLHRSNGFERCYHSIEAVRLSFAKFTVVNISQTVRDGQTLLLSFYIRNVHQVHKIMLIAKLTKAQNGYQTEKLAIHASIGRRCEF